MADILLEPALSLPSLLSTAELLGPDDDDDDEADDEDDALEQDVEFTPTAKRCDSHVSLIEVEEEEEDGLGDDPPSMTLREILLNADTGHFDLLGLFLFFVFFIDFDDELFFSPLMMCISFVDDDEEDAVLSGNDTSFEWE